MTNDRARANDLALPVTRRTALASTAAAGAALWAGASASAPEDPILPLYRQWVQARKDWHKYADLPGNEHWNMPESIEAADREDRAFYAMLELTPCSMEGIAALAHVLWDLDGPSVVPEHPEYAEQCERTENKLVRAIWRSASGETGLPPDGRMKRHGIA
ncbi:hypothetical protein [Rhodovulum marinum]|uniref:Uncharacterized protein n=1 Tax=Rhodovulum marinum TaxID=320662 RepID=A0A4R2PV30_9RHOB|nr:hypothetical protein [Rhodovulum marinum]TCP39799.1 hypothetical protein EV662_110106 [Rhodovulum marinum]